MTKRERKAATPRAAWKFNRGKGIDGPVAQAVLWAIMIVVIFLVLMPVLYTLISSLKNNYEVKAGVWTWPSQPRWGNWRIALSGITTNLINSLIICTVSTFTAVLLAAIASYVFTRHRFPGKNFLFTMVIALMIIPGVLTLTPSFLLTIELGIKDTWWALILPYAAGQQVTSIFLFRTFMGQQPADLYEAAMIDGATDFAMFTKICVPLAIPILAIQAVSTFGALYNDYLWPTLVITSSRMQTLMPVLRTLADEVSAVNQAHAVKYAMYLLSGIPLIFTTALGLKYFINGDFASGMKL